MGKKYLFTDLRADFEKECHTAAKTKNLGFHEEYRKSGEYVEWLERNVMKYRQESLDFEEMNAEITAQMEREHDGECCGCGCNGK